MAAREKCGAGPNAGIDHSQKSSALDWEPPPLGRIVAPAALITPIHASNYFHMPANYIIFLHVHFHRGSPYQPAPSCVLPRVDDTPWLIVVGYCVSISDLEYPGLLGVCPSSRK